MSVSSYGEKFAEMKSIADAMEPQNVCSSVIERYRLVVALNKLLTAFLYNYKQ